MYKSPYYGEWIIYLGKNKRTGERYIGSTKDTLYNRMRQHRLKRDNGSKAPLHLAMKKDSFLFEIITKVFSEEEAKSAERFFIRRFKTCVWEYGYNQRVPNSSYIGKYKADDDSYLYKYKVGLLSFKKAIETHGVCFVSGV